MNDILRSQPTCFCNPQLLQHLTSNQAACCRRIQRSRRYLTLPLFKGISTVMSLTGWHLKTRTIDTMQCLWRAPADENARRFVLRGFGESVPDLAGGGGVESKQLLLLLLLFPHISPISRTRGHRRRLPFPYHRYIQKTQTKEEKERKKITDEKTSPDLIGGEGKK